MRQIFTYPNNASTYYIDPRYIGDNTAGFQKRINDLMNENIYNIDTPPPQSLEDTLTFLGRYYNFYDSFGDTNITLFDIKDWEMAEIVSRSLAIPVTQIQSNSDGSATATTSRAHNITTGSGTVRYNIDVTSPSGIADLSSGSALASAFSYTTNTVTFPKSHVNPGGSSFRLIRDGDGVRLRTDSSLSGLTDGMRISHEGSFYVDDGGTVPTPAGTVVTANGNYYIKQISGTNYSYHLYTDSSLTTEATLTEEEGAGFYVDITGTGSKQTLLDYAPGGGFAQVFQDFCEAQPGDNGWCRVYFSDLSGGTFTPSVDSGKDIPDVGGLLTDYSISFYWEWDATNEDISFYTERSLDGDQNPMDWSLTNGETVRLNFDLIDPLRLTNDDIHFRYLSSDTLASDSYFMLQADWDDANNRAYHELDPDETKVYWYGTRARTYRDSGGNWVAGADISENVSVPGSGTRPNRTTDPRWVEQPVHTLGFTAGNKLNSWTISGGKFSTADVFRYAQNLKNKASEYVDPGPTNLQLAQAEDNFDLETNWDDLEGYTSDHKLWPDDVKPISVTVDMKTPVVSTYSQSGIKYARNAGYTRWALDVKYPPLTKEQIGKLISASQKARGGATKFYFKMYGQDGMFGFFTNLSASNYVPRVKAWDSANRVLTLEGLESNETGVIQEGQLLATNGMERNGGISVAVNNADANVYGEVKVKIPFNDWGYEPVVGGRAWFTVDKMIVTLGEDNFQYRYRGDGLYDCSVKFELGFWT